MSDTVTQPPPPSPPTPAGTTATPAESRPETKPKRLPPRCRFFAQGLCREGDQCRFRHELKPASASPKPETTTDNNSRRNRRRRAPKTPATATPQPDLPADVTDPAEEHAETASQDIPSQPTLLAKDHSPTTTTRSTPARAPAPEPARRNNRSRTRNNKPATPRDDPGDNAPAAAHVTSPRAAHLAALLAAYPTARLITPTSLTLSFTPSDPDFPYPLDKVHLALTVPLDYPATSRPTVTMTNDDIPENVRDTVSASLAHRLSPGQSPLTLVQIVQWMDKNLEKLIKGDLVAPKSTLVFIRPGAAARTPVAKPNTDLPSRDTELKALERRFRASWVQVSREEMQLTLVPTDPEWPFPGLDVHLGLTLPLAYGTSPAEGADHTPPVWRVLNTDVSPRLAARLEHVLAEAAAARVPLLATVNKLDRALVDIVRALAEEDELAEEEQLQHPSDSTLTTDDDEQEDNAPTTSAAQLAVPKSGATQIKLPALRLAGISVVECTSVSILVACVRCKTATELHGLSPLPPGTDLAWQLDSPAGIHACTKCAAPLGVRWTAALMHASHPVLGYASLLNCSPLDLLPCTFAATCEACTAPGQVLKRVVVGSQAKSMCRACHASLGLAYEVARFLRVGSGGLVTGGAPLAKRPPRAKSALEEGIVPGHPLPKQGRCSHYSKSFRWFRFPCCARAYPCDVCHEKGKPDDHEMVRANRMLCGYCAKEQPFSASGGCAFCHAELVAKTNSGFWEGGKGTRDVARMSNRESKKFKGLAKTASKKGERVGKEGADKVKKDKGKRAEA